MGVPFFSGDGFVFICQVGAVAALGAVAGIVVLRRFASRFLRLSPMQMAVALSAICIATVSAQKSGSNVVEETEGTNGVSEVDGTNTTDNADGETPPPLMVMLGGGALSCGHGAVGTPRPTIAASDIVRGYRLDSVSTNEAISYEAPDDATDVGVWHLTGAYEDVVKVPLVPHSSSLTLIPHPHPFLFPLGTNLCESLWAYTWGKVRPQLKNASNELVAVGSPMSALPGVSRFWTAYTTNDSFVLTWENFAVGRVSGSVREGADETVNAQLELYRNGDFVARSNAVETVYRRVNPDDWDDDGVANADDDEPTEGGDESFGPHQAYPGDLNTNHFCWVDLVVSNANALVTFVGDRPCRLADPKFVARAGETNRVYLLIGKTYAVHCDMPIACVDKEDEALDVWGNEHDLEIRWPVSMEFASPLPLLMARPLLGAAPPGGVRPQLFPPRVGGGSFSWENDFCCTSTGPDGVPCFNCSGSCGCGGCRTGDITYLYSGYDLTFGGLSCECESQGPEQPHPEDPHGSPAGPSVSAGFTQNAIIFEDAYENEPGVTIPRRSTEAQVEFYVYGGTNGGTYAFSIVNGDKLKHVGGDRLCEGTVGVGQSITIRARYEAVSASGREGDIVAKAEFTEAETHRHLTDMHSSLTAVRVEVEPVVGREGCPNRHRMGVREEFMLNTYPDCVSKSVSCPQDFLEVENVPGKCRCPIRASSGVWGIVVSKVDFDVSLSVVEPTGVLCTSGFDKCEDGCIAMELEPYITPMDVCFSNIRIMEVPTSANGPSGYFTNAVFSSIWCHTSSRGAGKWRRIGRDNFFFADTPSFAEYCPPPLAFGTIDWVIPLAWAEDDASSLNDTMGTIETVYHQVFTINAAGDLQIDKFSQWIRCSADGHVTHSQGIR